MTNLSTSRINHKDYNEAAALQQLLETLHETLVEMNDKYEAANDYSYLDEQFSISIGGKSIAFLLGGPQAQALQEFIKSIADENGYAVSNIDNTVTE